MRLLDRCLTLLRAFPQQTVLGIGDVMLDQYRRGTAAGLSPEAPAIDLLNPDLTETPGGAAVVAWNIGHVGGHVRMVGVVGKDAEAARLREILGQTPGVSFLAIEDPSRPTTLKLRFYHGPFQILRVSQELKQPLDTATTRACCNAVKKNLVGCGAVFVEDYGKQLINAAMVETLCELRRAHPELPVILDPKIGNHHVYRPGMCTLIKPNWVEACQLVDAEPASADHLAVARAVAAQYETDVLITLGAGGAFVFERA
ncbi:MAG: rfaE bifunctional protein, partial [Parcubacteria group bacterium Gr01-1014_38]